MAKLVDASLSRLIDPDPHDLIKRNCWNGLKKKDSYQKKRGIVLCNAIALIPMRVSPAAFILRLFVCTISTRQPFLISRLAWPVSGDGIANRLFLTTLSRLYLSLLRLPFFGTWLFMDWRYCSGMATDYDSFRIFFLAMSCIPTCSWTIKIDSFLSWTCSRLRIHLFFDTILKLAGAGPPQGVVAVNDFDFIHVRTIISYFLYQRLLLYFRIIILRNDEFNHRLVLELKEKTHEIEAQNDDSFKAMKT